MTRTGTWRRAQFFILTAVLVGGSLSITMALLSDYGGIDYNEVTSGASFHQYRSIQNNLDSLWLSEEWQYRRQVVIFERSGRLLDRYPVHIEVNTTRLIRQGKLQPDCDDIRLTANGEEIPYQIPEGECDTGKTSIWFLTSVTANAVDRDVALYYGNPDIGDPAYEMDLRVDADERSIENTYLDLVGAPAGSQYAFSKISVQNHRNMLKSGSFLPKGGSGNAFTVADRGPVFVDVAFDAGHVYRFFAYSRFVRWLGPHTLSSGDMPVAGSDNTIFDRWEAGNQTTNASIGPSGFQGGFSSGQPRYIGMYNRTTGETLMLVTNTSTDAATIGRYDAAVAGGELSIGLSDTAQTTVSHLDIWVGEEYAPSYVADRHASPPRLILQAEERGSFNPAGGWRERVRVGVEERNGSYLTNYPVNISVNLGELGASADCSNIVVAEDGVVRNHTLREPCDSLSFREPATATLRLPMDEGSGRFANGTDQTFAGVFQGDPVWIPGEHRFGLAFDDGEADGVDDHLAIRGPPVELRNSSFTFAFWFRADPAAQAYSNRVDFVSYPFDTPSFGLAQEPDGDYVLQGRFYNETEDMTLVNATITQEPTWRHAALVYNRSSERLSVYLNGDLEASRVAPGLLNLTSDDIKVARWYDGRLDELKIYTTALTQRELMMQYNERTKLTFLANLSASATEQDIAIYGNGSAGIESDTLTSVDAAITDPARTPLASLLSSPTQYRSAVRLVQYHLQSVAGLGPTVSVEARGGCTALRFETGQLLLRNTIC